VESGDVLLTALAAQDGFEEAHAQGVERTERVAGTIEMFAAFDPFAAVYDAIKLLEFRPLETDRETPQVAQIAGRASRLGVTHINNVGEQLVHFLLHIIYRVGF
jgi:hypothetical protein